MGSNPLVSFLRHKVQYGHLWIWWCDHINIMMWLHWYDGGTIWWCNHIDVMMWSHQYDQWCREHSSSTCPVPPPLLSSATARCAAQFPFAKYQECRDVLFFSGKSIIMWSFHTNITDLIISFIATQTYPNHIGLLTEEEEQHFYTSWTCSSR